MSKSGGVLLWVPLCRGESAPVPYRFAATQHFTRWHPHPPGRAGPPRLRHSPVDSGRDGKNEAGGMVAAIVLSFRAPGVPSHLPQPLHA